MKTLPNEDGLEGYVVIVEVGDLDTPLDLPELQGNWTGINWEGVFKRDGDYHCIYLTNNEFAIEVIIPERFLTDDIRVHLERFATS